jgi:hypothetical protein
MSTLIIRVRRSAVAAIAGAALAAASLAACTTSGGTSDDQMGRLLVAPDKFVLYNCAQLAEAAQTTAVRERELQLLMAKAGVDSAGRLVSALAYRPEYLTVRGEMNELRKAAAAKNCKFVPGAENPGGGTSDRTVR